MVGDLANVHWKSVSENDLCHHPLYCTLSKSSDLTSLSSIKQHTPEWQALHIGRLTTSSLASCLGFYETQTADKLGIPKSLRGHDRIVSAWEHLRSKPVVVAVPTSRPSSSSLASNTWISSSDHCFPFIYNPTRSSHETHRYSSASDIRLDWGIAQEPTAILAVINYLTQTGTDAVVCESGMCLLEDISWGDGIYLPLKDWLREGSLPLLGASPDGIIRYADGRIEVLEVKCVSPFQESNSTEQSQGRFRWCERSLHNKDATNDSKNGIAVWHIPQLQMEMLCAGPECQSALITVLYVNGAKIYRVERNDQYILSMMTLVKEFYCQFIKSVPSNRMKPPPINYSFPNNTKMYQQFIQHTIQIAQSAAVIATLDNSQIQRNEVNVERFL